MSWLLAGGVLMLLAAPYALALERAAPMVAVAIWFGSLALRSLACVYGALFAMLYVPTTTLYEIVREWCWHAVLPFVASHLQLTGHDLGDAAMLAPLSVLVLSSVAAAVAICRAARAVQRMLRTLRVGDGPEGSVIVGDHQVVVAAAGVRRPQVIVSAGALLVFDDQELAASLAHERGHIARRHRFILIAAEVLGAVARFVPDTGRVRSELLFHVERDADEYAVARDHEPASLASAICKAAESALVPSPGLCLGGSSVIRRLRALLDAPTGRQTQALAGRALACCLATVALAGAAALPAAAHAGARAASNAPAGHVCPA